MSPLVRMNRNKQTLELCAALRLPLIVAGALALGACGSDERQFGGDDVAAPPVEAVEARFGGLPLVERLSGTVWAENQIALYPEISGRITAVHVESGAEVERGEILVELDDQQYREQLRQAQAGFRINEARVRQAKAQLAELEAQARRTRSLGDQALVSEVELETLVAQVESARADVALAEAQLEEAAATRAEQEELMTKSFVRAPISGVVGQREAEIGMHVSTSTRLFTIGNLDSVTIEVNISDRMLRHIQVGQPVAVLTTTAEGDARDFRGELTRISPFLDEVTRSADAEIEIPNPDHWLRPGMFVAVDVHYGESRQATLLPTSALFTDPNTGSEGIFLVDTPADSSAVAPAAGETPAALSEPRDVEFRTVNVIARGAMEVAVTTVQPGDWVVTIGQDLLAEGKSQARVRPVTWEYVMNLQGMKREDLLQDILRATSRSDVSAMPVPSE